MRIVANAVMPTFTMAKFTVRHYIKERVPLVVLMFGFVLLISSYVLAPLAVGAQQKIITDVGLAAISLFGALLVILLGASSYSRERDKGILPSILARPIGRVDFVLGKYFGTVITIAAVSLLMGVVYLGVMAIGGNSITANVLTAIYLCVGEVALLTSVMTFFSSFSTPLLSSFLTLCVFVAGHLSKDLFSFAEQFGGTAFKLVAAVGYYTLPNFSLFNVRSEAVHNLPLLDGYASTVSLYGAFYVAALLFLSAVIFSRRDISS